MIKNILVLIKNDIAISFKNRSIYLILFIPLFAVMSLKMVDPSNYASRAVRIGIVQNEYYPSVIMKSIRSAGRLFTVTTVSDEKEGVKKLKDRELDGILTRAKNGTLGLIVVKKESFQALAILSNVAVLQRSAEGRSSSWISEIRSLQEGGIQKQALPTWVLMSVLLVGFIIMPAQVAEEKEKKLLLGLLQTPMQELEWVFAKLFAGMIMTFAAVILLHLMGGFGFGDISSYFLFLLAGSFCFCAFGIFLGFLCGSQASARTLGVLFYLPFMFPSALSDFSQKLSAVAPLLPSYQFYGPVKVNPPGRRQDNGFSAGVDIFMYNRRAWMRDICQIN